MSDLKSSKNVTIKAEFHQLVINDAELFLSLKKTSHPDAIIIISTNSEI